MTPIFNNAYFSSGVPTFVGHSERVRVQKRKAAVKASLISLILHVSLVAAIVFMAIKKEAIVSPVPTKDSKKPIISYLYQKPKAKLAPAQMQTQTSTQPQENSILREEKLQNTEVVETESDTEQIENEMPTTSIEALNEAQKTELTMPVRQPYKAQPSVLQSSATAIQNIQQTQQQAIAQEEAQAYRQRQESPMLMPLEQRIDTFESQTHIKVKKVYCDNLAKKMLVGVSFLTRGDMENAAVQCQQLPGFEQYIDKHKNKGQSEKQ